MKILDTTLKALYFHHSLLSYLKKRVLGSVDIINKLKLPINPKDNNQPITNSENKKMRKRLEYATKKNERHDNLCATIR